ncbi:hypothetical protein [Haloferax sp. ATB1]|uniref:hypothetical protein n=1 Tax=Haloferax sp. ATB1 TaxID=1508454 RepID=UPI0006940A7B|nr:hypothetical protein [Haloferax sp. ATB1]
MSDEDHQPELLLLHEAGGEIEGRGKYHKLLDRYRRESDETSVEHILKERGPFDEGLSRSIKRYLDLGLVETDEEGLSRDVSETEKGDRYMSGFERTKLYLDNSFKATRDRARNVISEFGDMSMNQMVQEQDVQEDKQRPLGTRLSTEYELGDEE